MDADFRRFAAFHLIPFGRGRDQFAVAVAPRDVGHYGRGQACGLAYFFALLLNHAFVGQFAKDAFQLGAVGVLQAEFPRDLAGSDFSWMRADEGYDGVPARKAALASSSALAGFAALAFLAPRFGLAPPFATRSSINAMASSSVMVSCVLSLGIVAVPPPDVT